MSKLKLSLFLIFRAVWKFQIRDRGRGGYCGSSWISLSSVHNSSHRLHFQKKIATQYKHIVHLDRSACHQCTFVHIACQNCSVAAKYCQIVHSVPQQSLSIQSLPIESLSIQSLSHRACKYCSTSIKYKKVHLNGSSCHNSTLQTVQLSKKTLL